MTDLTKIKKPLGMLKKKTRTALIAHNGPIDLYGPLGWAVDRTPIWTPWRTYRAAPTTKPSVDWSALDEKWRFIAVDGDDWAYAHAERPNIYDKQWVVPGGDCFRIDGFLSSYRPGTCDWRDSLIERPEGV